MSTGYLIDLLESLRPVTGFDKFFELTDCKEIIKVTNSEGNWRLGSVHPECSLSLASEVNISGVKGFFADRVSLTANDACGALQANNFIDSRLEHAFPSDAVALAESESGDTMFVVPQVDGVWILRHDDDSVDFVASDLMSWLRDSEVMSESRVKFEVMHVGEAPENLIGEWRAVESPHLSAEALNAQAVIQIDDRQNWRCDFPDSTMVFNCKYAITNKRKNKVAVLDDGEIHRYSIISVDENFLVLKGPDSAVIVKYERVE